MLVDLNCLCLERRRRAAHYASFQGANRRAHRCGRKTIVRTVATVVPLPGSARANRCGRRDGWRKPKSRQRAGLTASMPVSRQRRGPSDPRCTDVQFRRASRGRRRHEAARFRASALEANRPDYGASFASSLHATGQAVGRWREYYAAAEPERAHPRHAERRL